MGRDKGSKDEFSQRYDCGLERKQMNAFVFFTRESFSSRRVRLKNRFYSFHAKHFFTFYFYYSLCTIYNEQKVLGKATSARRVLTQ
mmetsp:Transcript_17531/g.36803  ORF Transcript_17531/g.36803 Transcript_17531/m.36803 type:complete len:86 (+) Transcript_17531:865-1122(+)